MEARKQLIGASLDAVTPTTERRSLAWRSGSLSLPIIDVPLTHVLLNPRSHRIKSQIKSRGETAWVTVQDPYSAHAQELIADIIRGTRGFDRVRATMARDGQEDPGVITHQGILINGNTRAVALRDNGAGYIKAQVLPEDATEPEITKLELDFQMKEDIKQPYTFTNRLIFIKDLLDNGMQPRDIGLAMDRSLSPSSPGDCKKAGETIKLEARLLAMIDFIVESSHGVMTYEDFDDERQNLIDIDSAYEALKKRGDSALAERVKQAKITGMLAGLDYRRVRLIDAGYLDGYVVEALKQESLIGGVAEVLVSDDSASAGDEPGGLDVLDGFDTRISDESVTLLPIFTRLAATPKDGLIEIPDPDGSKNSMTKEAFQAAVRNAMTVAADAKERDSTGTSALELPKRQISSAALACDKAIRAIKDVKDSPAFDPEDLRKAFDQYLQSHDELELILESLGIARPTD